MNLSDLSPEAQRIEHLVRARDELIQAMSPVDQRINFVDGYLGAIYESLITAINMLTYLDTDTPALSVVQTEPPKTRQRFEDARRTRGPKPGRNHLNLTDEQVRQIRREATTPKAIRAFAIKYGVTYPAIKYIVDGKSYKWVQ